MPVIRSVLPARPPILRVVLREGEGDAGFSRLTLPLSAGRPLSDRHRISCCVAVVVLTSCSPTERRSGSNLAVEAVEWDQVSHEYAALTDGAEVHLVVPPQGGEVLFIGALVDGISGNEIELTGRLRDLETDEIIEEDTRPATVQPMSDRPGFSETDPSSLRSVSNITLCPDYHTVDVVGRPYVLEIAVVERAAQASGSTRISVTPRCAQPTAEKQAFCECECQANYTLGTCSLQTGTNGG